MPPIVTPDYSRTFVGKDNPYSYLKVGVIRRVDPLHMKCDVAIITGGNTVRHEVDLTSAMAGPRSFWGGIPEVGSLVVIGYRRKHRTLFEAVIVGYLPTGNRTGLRFDPYAASSPSEIPPGEEELYRDIYGDTVRYKRLYPLNPGDVGGMSASGAEIALTKDLSGCARSGDGFSFRDSDRTFTAQSLHWEHVSSAATVISGAIRRGSLYLPSGMFQDRRPVSDYEGSDILRNTGPGSDPSGPYKFLNGEGELSSFMNQGTPTTYADGRDVFYVGPNNASDPPVSNEIDPIFTEHRLQINHLTDLIPPVTEGVDGFDIDQNRPYISITHGTVVGSNPHSTAGVRQYGKILKPSLFKDFRGFAGGNRFTWQEITRTPDNGDIESIASAGAFSYEMIPPFGTDTPFVAAISKQGKLFLQVPGSSVEEGVTKNISLEAAFLGAIKASIGASNPDRVSLSLSLDGGIHADIGSDSSGKAITVRYRSSVQQSYQGTPDNDDVAIRTEIFGVSQKSVTGEDQTVVTGSKITTVSGRFQQEADRMVLLAISGFTGNYGEKNELIAGKTQSNHAQAVLETIVTGGKVSTILAGGYSDTVLAGARTTNIAGGAFTTTVAAGAYTVSVGTGAVSISTGAGAVAISTGAGAIALNAPAGVISLTAGLAINLTSPVSVSFVSPQVLLGGPLAVLGVVRGAPTLPPGAPSLDFFLNIPYLGCATVRSI